ncbi:PREDICTED: succinate dehydrogenase assembly factor 4, mitochondrial-like [Ceratosolen solmsi marchali]|uniref:Succinate dehydrogenase assembly factor 4, mitochondrial n=1 Tax=Ceratosolen solmsi marchali TaxID=326594 RepID=A0AAJ6YN70_9HYME|nr:PREDICTED: succinate dehydrogenase assembly factor 4, mitochondrial-like [Ceratosolen solmsi marchali]
MLRIIRISSFGKSYNGSIRFYSSIEKNEDKASARLQEFRKKLKEELPFEKLEVYDQGKHPDQEREPLQSFPNNINPVTGEIDGPIGPEPTRYGDWERKGRVTDF